MTDSEYKKLTADITEIKTNIQWLIKSQDNHLMHHMRYSIMAFGAALSAITALIILVIKIV